MADFYAEVMAALQASGLRIKISTLPQELADPVPFERDRVHAAYDPVYGQRFWRVLAQAERVLQIFRARFIGKCSPVHFFWGSFDSAITRFSGRRLQRGRRGDLGGVLARGEQLRILAGRRPGVRADVLCLCVPGAGRV